MSEAESDIGLIGLGVMGRNLALNIADNSFNVAGYDRDEEKVSALTDKGDSARVHGASSIGELISQIKRPRAILLMIPAGKPVDDVIDEIKGRLDAGDIIIDGGNSHFTDTNRRFEKLTSMNIDLLGVGISGGSDGARHGPSIMPGGQKEAYNRVRTILEAISAKVNGDPCVTYLGPGSAGHYVKMVHNGIEYALMQLISEVYDILKRIGRLSNDEMADVFENWNDGALNSFLIEITFRILRVRDKETNQKLVDMILDAARQKGTGKWTSQDAMELQVPIPTIDAAVGMRDLSGFKGEREKAAKIFPASPNESDIKREELIKILYESLHFGMISSYAQGMALLRKASAEYRYDLRLADIARIWRGGCIIRAEMLDDIMGVFQNERDTSNLMTKMPFSDILKNYRNSLCKTVQTAMENKVAIPAMYSALSYFDGYRTFRLPANLIQAQRDYFGSHTYERIDREGTFHTDWS
jgi:6-phosphogluconate dehydrogenase